MPTKLLTDAEKNRQAILNRQLTGKVQGGVTLTEKPKVVSTPANTASGRKLQSISKPSSAPKASINISKGSIVGSDTSMIQEVPSQLWSDYSKNNPEGTYEDFQRLYGAGKSDPTIVINEATNKPFTYNEMEARGMLEDRFKKADARYFAKTGKHLQNAPSNLEYATWDTIEAKIMADQKKQQEEEMAYQKQQADIAKELDQSQLDTASKQSQAAIAATEASIGSADREGVVSAGNRLVSSQFTSQMDKNMREMTLRVESAQMARDKALKDLEAAYTSQNEELSEALAQQFYNAEEALTNAQAARDKEASAQSAVAFDRLSKLSEISKNSGGGIFTGWTPDDIASTLGVDIGTASMVANIDARIASMDTSDIDYAQKVANLQKTQQEAIWSGMTPDAKNFAMYQQLLSINSEQAEKFAQSVGISDNPSVKEKLEAEKLRLEIAKLKGSEFNVNIPSDGKYAYELSENGVSWASSLPVGTVLSRGECGQLVNDALVGGPGLMGDTFADKMRVTLPELVLPVAGGAFVEHTDDGTGHCGLVERVYPDGSFDVRESNYIAPNTVSVSHIVPGSERWDTIVNEGGFWAKNIPNQEQIELADSILDPYSDASLADLTPTEKAKVLPIINQKKQKIMEENPGPVGVMLASAGGGDPTDSFVQSMEKAGTVVNQFIQLKDSLDKKTLKGADGNSYDLSPVTGWLREKNPWDADAQAVTAILRGTIPNLARGIYGEVGVLTNADIENYIQTVPNLRSTEDVKNLVMAATLRVVKNSIENKIVFNANSGKDMSRWVPSYQKLTGEIEKMEAELGVVTAPDDMENLWNETGQSEPTWDQLLKPNQSPNQ